MRIEAVVLTQGSTIICEYWQTSSLKIKRLRNIIQQLNDSPSSDEIEWYHFDAEDLNIYICSTGTNRSREPLANELHRVFVRSPPQSIEGEVTRVVRSWERTNAEDIEASLDTIESSLQRNVDRLMARGESLQSLQSGASNLLKSSHQFVSNVESLEILKNDDVKLGVACFIIFMILFYAISM